MLLKKMIICFCNLIKLMISSLSVHAFQKSEYFDNHWLICEKKDEARDNGFAFFEFLKKYHPEVKVYYVIDKNSVDAYKLDKYGNYVVNYGSMEHYKLYLTSKVLISSQTLPYPCSRRICEALKFCRLLTPEKVWLQHGVTKDKLKHKNMDYNVFEYDLLSCASDVERNFLCSEYGYPPKVAQTIGFCRFDKLYRYRNCDQTKNWVIMPTFRSWLKPKNKIPTSQESRNFLKSYFFENYVKLVNSDEMNNILHENNIKLYFYLHYALQGYSYILKDYIHNSNVIIATSDKYDVQSLLLNSDLLITDYSSVFFDFAYMKKPEVFFQFDLKQYRNKHYKPGYFDYGDNGFGEVDKTQDEVIESLKRIITNDMQMSSLYKKRVDDFFKYTDRKNSERTYNAIMAINNVQE